MVIKYNRLLYALFLCFLMIILPIHFSVSVQAVWTPHSDAGTIGNELSGFLGDNERVIIQSITADSNVPGFRKIIDTMTVVVWASLGKDVALSADDLELMADGFILGTFDSCSVISQELGVYECTFTEGEVTPPVNPSRMEYTVNLFNGVDIVSSDSEYINVDALPPTIKSFSPEHPITRENTTKLFIDLAEYGYGNMPGVGLKQILVSVDDIIHYRFSQENDPVYDEYDFLTAKTALAIQPVLPLGTDSKPYSICIEAIDYFDQSSSECVSVVVDRVPPSIFPNTFHLEKSGGVPVGWFKDSPASLEAYIDFQAPDLDLSSIYANFSDLHKLREYSVLRPTNCLDIGDNAHRCRFLFNAHINATKTYRFNFYASDKIGNSAHASATSPLRYDGTAPLATNIYMSSMYGENFLGHGNTSIRIDFTESGSGMNSSESYISLGEFGGPESIKASGCTPSWRCEWQNISINYDLLPDLPLVSRTILRSGIPHDYDVDARSASIVLLPSTTDDVGNNVQMKRFNVTLDIFPPKIEYSNITTIHASPDLEEFTLKGDTISIYYNISDAFPVQMEIIADDFISNFSETVSCIDNNDGIYTCSYMLGPIDNQGYYIGNLSLRFIDMLGNDITDSHSVEVFLVEDFTTKYWDAGLVSCSPNPLDKELVSRINSDIFCMINLNANPGVVIYEITGGDCIGLPVNISSGSAQRITPSPLANKEWLGLTAKQPVMYLNIQTPTFSHLNLKALNYKCNLNIRSIIDKKIITRGFEEVEIDFSIDLFNSPIEEVSSRLWKKVDSIYDTYLRNAWGILGYLQGIVDLSEKLCAIVDTLSKISTIWRYLCLMMGIADAAQVAPNMATKYTTFAQDVSQNSLDDLIGKTWATELNKFCAFISCKLVYGESWKNWLVGIDQAFSYSTLNVLFDGDSKSKFEHTQALARKREKDNGKLNGKSDPSFIIPNIAGIDPKNNWVLSFATLCIPGMIHNLEKYRQIQCEYGSCLVSHSMDSIPNSLCDENKAYSECKFFYGGLFQFFPLAGFMSMVQSAIIEIMADPISIIRIALNMVCNPQIYSKLIGGDGSRASVAVYFCSFYNTIELVVDVYTDLKSYSEMSYWSLEFGPEKGSCKTFAESYERLGERMGFNVSNKLPSYGFNPGSS
jgi:hypothetical protein